MRNIVLVACALLVLFAIALLVPRVNGPPTARLEACQGNLSRIMDALKAYADDHGKFPRAYVQDEEGRRKHSWRVLILPYLDKDEIYNQYDFAQSWDSPHNLALAPEIAELFQCPSDPAVDLENPHTNYFAVAGPGTLWEDRVSIATLKGPLHEIIAVVEMAVTEDLEVKVFEPRDLRFDDLLSGLNRR